MFSSTTNISDSICSSLDCYDSSDSLRKNPLLFNVVNTFDISILALEMNNTTIYYFPLNAPTPLLASGEVDNVTF